MTRRIVAVATLFVALHTTTFAEPITGRYVLYGNPLSPFMEIAEIEVFSGGENVIAGHPEYLSQDYLFKIYRGTMSLLVDGKKDTEQRHIELISESSQTYSDSALSYCSVEIDLGRTVPVDKIDVHRARYTYRRGGELGWRYLLVLDEDRRIVAWEAYNVFHKPHPSNKGHWSFEIKAATDVLAGRVVPAHSRSWLSEAEFIRDFLGKPVDDRTGDLTEDEKDRLGSFDHRNDPDAIRELGVAFFRIVNLDRPSLAQVKALVDREKYAEALDAFKAPFFETITPLAGKGSFEYTWGYDPDSRDTMRVRDLVNHVYGDKKTLTVTTFQPGLMPPAKFEFPFQMRPLLLAHSATGDGKLLALWQEMMDDWAMGFQDAADKDPDLREHFVLTGNVIQRNLQDLAQAADENPDFVDALSGATLARFITPIVEEIPVSIWRVWRKCVFNHTYNATGGAYELAKLLADFRAGTRLEREFRQQTQRLHTLSQYRDGPMAEIGDEGHFVFNFLRPAHLYGELCVDQPDWFTPDREAYMLDRLRQAELVAVRHTSPGGVGNRWSWGPNIRYPTFEAKFNQEIKSLARGEPVPEASLCSLLQRASIMHEAQPRAVADTVYGWRHVLDQLDPNAVRKLNVEAIAAQYHPTPRVVSDWLPYSGCYYFRGGWERGSAILHMLKPAIVNSNLGGHNHMIRAYEALLPTSYRLQDYMTPLLSVFATEIEGQGPCAHYKRFPSGSKQCSFSQAVEKPQPRRWFSDGRLDFGEAVYEGVYHNVYRYRKKVGDTDEYVVEYEDDPALIEGVTTSRQIIQVRPARMFLQIERVTYASPDETHTSRIPATLMLTEPGPETKKIFSDDQLRIDADAHTVKSRNPGNPGVTVAWCGQPELSFKQYSVNTTISKFWPQPDPEKVDPKLDEKLFDAGWGTGFQTLNGPRRTTGRGLFAQWQAQGASVLVGAIIANAPGEEPVRQLDDISTDTYAGLRAKTAEGVVVTLLSARSIPARLEAGNVAIDGEVLLLVDAPKHAPTVMVLGAKRLAISGQPVTLTAPNVTFDIPPQPSTLNLHPIDTPLDPPTIEPGVNVFVDSTTVTLSTTSPGAIIRYTTDMPASRMNAFRAEAAKLKDGRTTLPEAADRLALREQEGANWETYNGPFRITEDTLVRARTFRKGVTDVPTYRAAGDDVSMISYGFFARRDPKPAASGSFRRFEPGLEYDYLEGRWFALWTYSDVLPAKKSGEVSGVLDVSMRETDGPFGVRYRGFIDIPRDGVYTLYGPAEFINNACAPGYDLRVYIDGEEWNLGQAWHGRGLWSVPLAKGPHRFLVTFADARAKDIENQHSGLWRYYPHPRTTWRGVVPVLEMSGPRFERQPIPTDWLKRER